MTYFLYFFICLGLMLLQTSVLPSFGMFDNFYDLIIAFVVYLGVFRPVRESMPVIVFLGFVMDTVSGGPFGLYLTSYLWLYGGLKWIIRYLHVGNSVLVLFVVSAAVAVENVFYMGTVFLAGPEGRLSAHAVRILVIQLAWATITGPFFLTFLNFVHQRWNMLFERLATEKNSQALS